MNTRHPRGLDSNHSRKTFQRWAIADGDGDEPKPFKGDGKLWQVWSFKMLSYVATLDQTLFAAMYQVATTSEEATRSEALAADLARANRRLYFMLVLLLEGQRSRC